MSRKGTLLPLSPLPLHQGGWFLNQRGRVGVKKQCLRKITFVNYINIRNWQNITALLSNKLTFIMLKLPNVSIMKIYCTVILYL